MYRFLFLLSILSLFGSFRQSYAQTIIPFDSPRWTIKAKSAIREEYLGRPCLKLSDGKALLADASFTNGIIEFDIALEKNRYFPGIGFRMQDEGNGEIYYLRPHQSGNPDAMQYYPENHGGGGWQLYYGQGFNKAHVLPFDRWLHIRILVDDHRAEIYFDNEEKPVLYIQALQRPISAGMIELQNEYEPAARYANFSITPMDHCTLQSPLEPAPVLPATVIRNWQVSTAFDETAIDSMMRVPASAIQWQKFQTDERGIADLARLSAVGKGHNTIICRIDAEADMAVTKRLAFGFSDRVRIYCNKKLLYAGSDVFMSRDYRFLGTIGFFDTVFPELRKGHNEIWLVVSEDFGGWGVEARLESL